MSAASTQAFWKARPARPLPAKKLDAVVLEQEPALHVVVRLLGRNLAALERPGLERRNALVDAEHGRSDRGRQVVGAQRVPLRRRRDLWTSTPLGTEASASPSTLSFGGFMRGLARIRG
jgi:hypothetical protein